MFSYSSSTNRRNVVVNFEKKQRNPKPTGVLRRKKCILFFFFCLVRLGTADERRAHCRRKEEKEIFVERKKSKDTRERKESMHTRYRNSSSFSSFFSFSSFPSCSSRDIVNRGKNACSVFSTSPAGDAVVTTTTQLWQSSCTSLRKRKGS